MLQLYTYIPFNLISYFILYILYLPVLPCKYEFTILHPICFYNRAMRRVHKMQAALSIREKERRRGKTAVQRKQRAMTGAKEGWWRQKTAGPLQIKKSCPHWSPGNCPLCVARYNGREGHIERMWHPHIVLA